MPLIIGDCRQIPQRECDIREGDWLNSSRDPIGPRLAGTRVQRISTSKAVCKGVRTDSSKSGRRFPYGSDNKMFRYTHGQLTSGGPMHVRKGRKGGLGEEVALHQRHTATSKDVVFFLGLDAFSEYLDAELAAKSGD